MRLPTTGPRLVKRGSVGSQVGFALTVVIVIAVLCTLVWISSGRSCHRWGRTKARGRSAGGRPAASRFTRAKERLWTRLGGKNHSYSPDLQRDQHQQRAFGATLPYSAHRQTDDGPLPDPAGGTEMASRSARAYTFFSRRREAAASAAPPSEQLPPSTSVSVPAAAAAAGPRRSANAGSGSGVDRNTSVRSVASLPAYTLAARPNEKILGREGERAGVDVVIEFPETVEEEESRRDDEMESLYLIRQARRAELAEREERRQLMRDARAAGNLDLLAALRHSDRRRRSLQTTTTTTTTATATNTTTNTTATTATTNTTATTSATASTFATAGAGSSAGIANGMSAITPTSSAGTAASQDARDRPSAADMLADHRATQASRERRISAVSYSQVGLARHDGTRVRADSDAGSSLSDAAPLLAAAAPLGLASTTTITTRSRRGSSATTHSRISSLVDGAYSYPQNTSPPPPPLPGSVQPAQAGLPDYRDGPAVPDYDSPPPYESPVLGRGDMGSLNVHLPTIRIATASPDPTRRAP